jgi:hypothetical protein
MKSVKTILNRLKNKNTKKISGIKERERERERETKVMYECVDEECSDVNW